MQINTINSSTFSCFQGWHVLIPFAGTIYRPYASTSENINLLSGIYFCGVHIQSGRLQSDSHQPVAEKKLSILYQEEKQADYQTAF